MKKKTLAVLAATSLLATGLLMTPAHAAPKKYLQDREPCSIAVDGTTVCPYADDEPGEYVENFYSGEWGSAGGGGIIIGDTSPSYWYAHTVYKLDQKAEDAGAHDVVLQDKRVKDKNAYSINLNTLASSVNKITALNVTVGECSALPEASCVTVVDFTSTNPNVGGYMSPKGLHARHMAFNPTYMKGKEATRILLHEGGHAFGLSHKHSPTGVMSYYNVSTSFSPDEVDALQLAYGAPAGSGGKTKIDNPNRGKDKGNAKTVS